MDKNTETELLEWLEDIKSQSKHWIHTVEDNDVKVNLNKLIQISTIIIKQIYKVD